MQLVFDIPDQFSQLAEASEWIKQFKLNTALMLFKEGEISIGLAKDLAGIDIYAFMDACAKHKIPVVNYSVEDLAVEIENIRQYRI